MYIGSSPVGQVILVSRASIHRNRKVSIRADNIPVHAVDIVRITREVMDDEEEQLVKGTSLGKVV